MRVVLEKRSCSISTKIVYACFCDLEEIGVSGEGMLGFNDGIVYCMMLGCTVDVMKDVEVVKVELNNSIH